MNRDVLICRIVELSNLQFDTCTGRVVRIIRESFKYLRIVLYGFTANSFQNVKVRVCGCHYFSELLRVHNIIITFAVWEVKSEALR